MSIINGMDDVLDYIKNQEITIEKLKIKNKQLESENFGLYNFGLTKEELENEIKKYQDENQKLKDIINSIKDLIV
tara:strand:+ start:306 stop:530 length:225 start_codon:yes stop_codon:yes gene_type:complete